MATKKQIDFIKKLYHELGQQPEDGIEDLSVQQASDLIKELLEIKKKYEYEDDSYYWYN